MSLKKTDPIFVLKNTKNILFDLDGTITNPFLGITNCIRYALDKLNASIPKDLKWCIGPPLQDSFKRLLGTASSAHQALAFYRERFASVGIFENEIYAGIPEMLSSLGRAGYRLYIATSKPHVYATQIIEHFELTRYFHKIYGAELDGTRSNKDELIRYILCSEGISNDDSVMVGDRMHDLIAGRKNNMRSIGIAWGYGELEELEKEEPEVIFHAPEELTEYFVS